MGQNKKVLAKNEEENRHSGYFCIRDGYEIPKDDLKFARQEDGSYLCSFCRAEKEKIEKE